MFNPLSTPTPSDRLLSGLVLLLALCSLITTLYSADVLVNRNTTSLRSSSVIPGQNVVRSYTFDGDDHPNSYPLENLPLAQMTVEESVHYSLTHSDEYEWLYNSPYGTGAVRVGPDNRGFFVSMFHQLHCLRYFQSESHTKNAPSSGHVSHCFNYLRQMILCAGDLTLEPGDFTKKNYTLDRTGQTHVCRDWTAVYDALADNWVDWYQYRHDHNLTDLSEGAPDRENASMS